MKARLKQSGANEGVEFRNWKYRANTLPGHRLVALSRKYGKSHEANAVLFRKAYEEGENISDGDVLIEAAEELQLGASREEINAFVRGDEGVMEVLHDDEMAKRRYVRDGAASRRLVLICSFCRGNLLSFIHHVTFFGFLS